MFTETLTKKVLRSPLVDLLTGPHGVDRYTELVDPTWTTDARARVVDVRRATPRSVTLLLAPNDAFAGHRAGQHLNLTVEIDGRRHTRCYSPAGAEGSRLIELTIGCHEGGLVSNHLYRQAHPGMVVGLSEASGEFVMPDPRPKRILFVAGGSGITPVMSMLRTLQAEGFDGEIAFIHYARTPAEACYREELAATGVRVLHGYTRSPGGELTGHFGSEHLQTAMAEPDAVYVCGPPALVDAVRAQCANVASESFVPLPFVVPDAPSGGRISFRDSGIDATDDGRPLLDQAEDAGLNPTSGCRMGICHSCTRRKHRGAVRNLTTGAVSIADEEDVQICVSVPVGDVDIAL
ncbi:ferredoxin reductase [Mycolicibacterium sphagni]|jgi:ferredoxin-NADP reductase|uniref:ferredoxin reductase n=1 Tax=Mycolicibacterium sphagni TaxID=1786 RepID=UPI001A9C9981|nr:FAD-binding oxidoreductase [Mycolicibacterium sphagni]